MPDSRKSPDKAPAKEASVWLLALVATAIAAGVQVIRLRLLSGMRFDPDEFQHLHTAWRLSKGEMPYRDFFDHHVPLFHLLLAPLFGLFRVDADFGAASSFLFLARRESWVLSGVVVVLTFLIGRAWRGTVAGLLAAGLVASSRTFVQKSLEARPDVLALALLLGSVWTLLEALERAERSPVASLRLLIASGILIGTGLVTTQKLLFPALGLWAAIVLKESATTRWSRAAIHFLAAAVPVTGILAFLAAHRALAAFFEYAIMWNLRWKIRFSPFRWAPTLVTESPVLFVTGALGFLAVLFFALRRVQRPGDTPILLTGLAVVAGLFLNPVPWLQSFLPLFPVLALFGAALLVELSRLAPGPEALRSAGLAGVLALSSFGPLRRLPSLAEPSNATQLSSLKWVLANTKPVDTVLDTWTGQGVFRPHAWFFFFLHFELRAMLTPDHHRRLIADLESGAIRPELIVFDQDLRELSPELTAYFERHYAYSAPSDLWRRAMP